MHKKKQFSPQAGESAGSGSGNAAIEKVLLFGLGLFASLRLILADKKVTFQEAIGLLPQVMQLPELVSEFPAIQQQWKDRTPETLESLKAFVKLHFDLDDDKLEEAIEAAFTTVADLVNTVDRFGDLKPKTGE